LGRAPLAKLSTLRAAKLGEGERPLTPPPAKLGIRDFHVVSGFYIQEYYVQDYFVWEKFVAPLGCQGFSHRVVSQTASHNKEKKSFCSVCLCRLFIFQYLLSFEPKKNKKTVDVFLKTFPINFSTISFFFFYWFIWAPRHSA
jgi:hypothetical protein